MASKTYAPSTNSTISLLTATNKREKTPVMSQRTATTHTTAAAGDMETKIFNNKKTVFDPKMFTRSESAASIDLLKLR